MKEKVCLHATYKGLTLDVWELRVKEWVKISYTNGNKKILERNRKHIGIIVFVHCIEP